MSSFASTQERQLDKLLSVTAKEREALENRKQSSDFQSFVNSCKLVFGNAYLTIPHVFSLTGWLGGLSLFGVVGSLNLYTMLQNLDLHDRYPQTHSYSEIGAKVLGPKGKLLVDISIWMM